MKKIILLPLFVFIFTLLHSQTQSKKKVCEKQIYYGGTEICLPKITGKTECYSLPILQEFVSYILASNSMDIMGVYLSDETYNEIEYLDAIPFDGVILVYAQKNMKYVKGNVNDLNQVAKMMKKHFAQLDSSLDDVTIFDDLIKFGKPVLLSDYSPNKNVQSFKLLTYMKYGQDDYVNICIMNMMIVKEKLITLAYYDMYKDKSSLEAAKAMNDYIVLRFLEENIDVGNN